MHDKKEKGDIGVAFAIARLTELGWSVCIPLKEHKKYDLIAEKDGKCKTVQVKYTSPRNGSLKVFLSNTWTDKNGVHKTKHTKGNFDILAVFCPINKNVYFIKDEDINNKDVIILRLEKAKNNQKQNIRMASDFAEI